MAKGGDIFRKLAEDPEFAAALSGLFGGQGSQSSSSSQQASGQSAGQSSGSNRLDQFQFLADVAGIADPTGIVDAANAAIYLGRAVKSSDQTERREHLKNALVSGISIIPYVGDLAKLSKFRKGSQAAGAGAQAATGGGGGLTNTLLQELLQGGVAGAAAGSLVGLAGGGRKRQPDDRRYTIRDTIGGPTGRLMREDAGRLLGRNWDAFKTGISPFTMPHTKLATSFTALTRNVSELPGMLEAWGESLSESQKHLRQFNGVISVAVMESERRDIMRNIASGARTGASTSGLMSALSDFKDVLQPFRDDFTNFVNTIGTGVLKLATTAVNLGTMAISLWSKIDARVAAAKAIYEVMARRNESRLQTMDTPGKESMQYFRDWTPTSPRPGGAAGGKVGP